MPTKKAATKSAAPKAKAATDDWRVQTLAHVRALIEAADPGVTETPKWKKPSNNMKGVPVWEHDGIICTGETYKAAVKLTFANGAALDDPAKLFNASLEGGTRRAIDIKEGEKINEKSVQNADPRRGRFQHGEEEEIATLSRLRERTLSRSEIR